jgi:hypothetical protein
METVSMVAHSLETGNLSVRNDVFTTGKAYIGAGLTIGTGGFVSRGYASINGNFSVSTSSYSLLNVNTEVSRVGVGTSTGPASLFVQGTSTYNPFTVASSTGVTLFTITSSGGVGIGTTTPGSMLDVYSSTASSDIDLFRIASAVGGSNNIKFRIDSDGDLFTDGGTTIGTPADLAEMYPALEAVDAGTVVAFGSSTVAWDQIGESSTSTESYEISGVKKADNVYEAVGVISTKAGITLGGNTTNGVPVAFVGRVPVKVTTENGEIKRGDYLTVSPTRPGYAMKLTGEGRSIGRAISDYVQGRDKVMMAIETGYQRLDTEGRYATTSAMLTTGNIDLNANGVAIYNIKSLASANGTWSIDENGRIVAKEICIEDVCIDKTTLTNILNSTGQSGVIAGTSTAETTTTPSEGGDEATSQTETSMSESLPASSEPAVEISTQIPPEGVQEDVPVSEPVSASTEEAQTQAETQPSGTEPESSPPSAEAPVSIEEPAPVAIE